MRIHFTPKSNRIHDDNILDIFFVEYTSAIPDTRRIVNETSQVIKIAFDSIRFKNRVVPISIKYFKRCMKNFIFIVKYSDRLFCCCIDLSGQRCHWNEWIKNYVGVSHYDGLRGFCCCTWNFIALVSETKAFVSNKYFLLFQDDDIFLFHSVIICFFFAQMFFINSVQN